MTSTTFSLVSETYYLDSDALLIARGLVRGEYQRSLVEGTSRWSGADLRGQASKWGARYSTSRRSLLSAMRGAGLRLTWVHGSHGRRVLIVSSEDCTVRAEGPRNGERVGVVESHPAAEFGAMTIH